MRPPSYYTSLANSNQTSNRTSSQQLRSSLSSPSSSAYVNRTHLPFVAQSTLVAHCFTGVGSSTKPYGQSSYTSLTTSSYLPSYTSGYTRPKPTSYSTNPYISASNSNYSSPSRASYLSSRSSNAYRPSSSSYYKPIRLRERPLLNQISRQINSSSTPSTRLHSLPTTLETKSNSTQINNDTGKIQEERDWSLDVARNISRNKYLIKFREIDKHSTADSAASLTRAPTSQILKETSAIPELSSSIDEDLEQVAEELVKEAMKLPDRISVELIERSVGKAAPEAKAKPDVVENRKSVDCDITCEKAVPELKKSPQEKKLVKLKIKSSNNNATVELQTTQCSSSPKLVKKKSSPDTSLQTDSPLKSPRNKKLVKTNKTKTKVKTAKEGQSQVDEPKSTITTLDSKVESDTSSKVLVTKDENRVQNQTQVVKPNSADGSPSITSKRIRFREYKLEDFDFLTVLGHGGWGFVILAELKDHDACFAVKCIKKITIVEDDDFDSIMIERKVLTLGNIHPFICKLFCTFETEGYLFFVMEYCAGGDLMFHVQKEGKFTEPRSRFYAAEIICAIRFLHNRHIIYRDLKLDNILLDSSGHVRLVDFGMCQCRTYREEMLPSNFCGTPEYISPEIIKGVPYNHSVDWWSFGVLLYEMAVGKMPFRGNDENELLWNVCYEQIHYPMFLTKELTELLKSLLEREPSKRMGMATCKAGDIYDQAWFRTVDWSAIEERRVKPPFVPQVDSKRDVQNFDADFTESRPELSPVDEATLERIDQNQFQKFPYTNPDIFIFN